MLSVSKKLAQSKKVNLLPGPVYIDDEVVSYFRRVPISHREERFTEELSVTKKLLRQLTRCERVQVCLGSGSLTNDIIAAQLSGLQTKGLVLSNGEFGDRLIDHAQRFGMDFVTIRKEWGEVFDYEEITRRVQKEKLSWLWFVHHETSTGILNDLEAIKNITWQNNLILCADCISSLGAVPLDLRGVDFASGSSGKALRSYSGLSFVFYKKTVTNKKIPRYLDLTLYENNEGVPFTSSSNLLSACRAALQILLRNPAARYSSIREQTATIRNYLFSFGIPVLCKDSNISPIMTTITLPDNISSLEVGDYLEERGILVHYKSSYLERRNWLQLSSMSEYDKKILENMTSELNEVLPLLGEQP